MLFRLDPYVRAEHAFVGDTIRALSMARGGIVSEISSEPVDRVQTTQVTTDSGATVVFEPLAVASSMKLAWDDIVNGNVAALLTTLDEAAEQYHEGLSKAFFDSLDRLTEGTGLRVDASGRDFFDSYYEMLEKVEVPFESDGSISPSFQIITDPETGERIEKARESFTLEQQEKLNTLLSRKHKEALARRRTRRLS